MNATVLSPSAWGVAALARADIQAEHLPHGIDLNCFSQPSPSERIEARSRLGIPRDAFVVGMVAANVEWVANRKSFPECLMGFAEFHRRRSDTVLYLHTDLEGSLGNGMDLVELIDACGVPADAVLATKLHRLRAGLSAEEIATLMGCFDVLLAPSAGEGFGIPVIEAQACGAPVIVSDFTAQPELAGAGWIIGGQRRWAPWANSWLFTPNIGEITGALLEAYDHAERLRADAVSFAQSFCIDRLVRERWVPLLRDWLAA
jgi:glycosyltransferase involved in cell wall biosynthesis